MEIYKEGIYWKVRNTRGPVPKQLQGMYTSEAFVKQAIENFQSLVRSRAKDTVGRRQNYKRDIKETDAPSNAAFAS